MFGKIFRGRGEEAKFELTSMIDVVFLLLIFFMCAAKFKQIEQRLDAFLPPDGRGPAPMDVHPPPELMIFVKDDDILRGSTNPGVRDLRRATYYLASRDAMEVNDPRALLETLRQLTVSNPAQRVVIAPFDEVRRRDQRVPFYNIVSLLDVCKMAGVQHVGFQAPASP